MDPFREIAREIEKKSQGIAKQMIMGLPSELGTITSTGLKLDNFKHEIRDFLVADWEIKVELPAASRVTKIAAPVNADGTDISGSTTYSDLTRLDFNVQGVGDPKATVKVHLDLKSGLKPGDRVLVSQVNGGQDFVVIAKVVTYG